jgi:DNA (cytosine-5)-methyltransferase 1
MKSRRHVCAVCDADAAYIRSARPPYEALRPVVRVVDLFCGCGGLSAGVAEAARALDLGIEIPLALDIDGDAVTVFRSNFPGSNVQLGEVGSFIDGELGAPLTSKERRLARSVGPVDVLVGGPPCQGHSDLNNHTRREDPRNALYAKMARAARVLRPAVVLVENVPTVQHDTRKVVEAAIEGLKSAGYEVGHRVVDLTLLGVPQRRRRHVVLASLHPQLFPTQLLDSISPRCEAHPVRTTRWAIEDLLGTPGYGMFDMAGTPSRDNLKRMKWLLAHDRHDLPNRLRPDCHKSEHSYNSMYGRLSWDAPAQTVTTGFGSMGQGRYVHPAEPRTITPHEAARLQMLPDFLDFGDVRTRGSLARLVGNAVPPVLATVVIGAALNAIDFPASRDQAVLRPSNSVQQRAAKVDGISGESRTDGKVGRKPPPPSSEAAGHRMRAVRRTDTEAERRIQAELDRLGMSYEVDAAPLKGYRRRADIVFRRDRVAVYVDGCFWHGCPSHATAAKSNSDWWRGKLERNRERDLDSARELRANGWLVLRFWEHESPPEAAAAVRSALNSRRKAGR